MIRVIMRKFYNFHRDTYDYENNNNCASENVYPVNAVCMIDIISFHTAFFEYAFSN